MKGSSSTAELLCAYSKNGGFATCGYSELEGQGSVASSTVGSTTTGRAWDYARLMEREEIRKGTAKRPTQEKD